MTYLLAPKWNQEKPSPIFWGGKNAQPGGSGAKENSNTLSMDLKAVDVIDIKTMLVPILARHSFDGC